MSEFMSGFMLEPHLAYNWMIVVYFFVGGLSAGAYLLSVIVGRWMSDGRVVARNAAFVAPLAMIPGLALLVLDLGSPMRAPFLGIHFNPTSVLSWGSIFLGVFFAISVLHALQQWKDGWWSSPARKLAPVGAVCAVIVASYTGLLLNGAPGLVLWHNALLPVLFLNGGLISGIAATLLFSRGEGADAASSKLGRIAAALVVLELAMLLGEVIVLARGGAHAANAAHELMFGQYSMAFWALQIVAGSAIPALLLANGKGGALLRAAASILLLVGVYTMRHIVVIGGQIIG